MSAIARTAGRWSGTSASASSSSRCASAPSVKPSQAVRARSVSTAARAAGSSVASSWRVSTRRASSQLASAANSDASARMRLGVRRLLAQRLLEAVARLVGRLQLLAVDAPGVEQRLDGARTPLEGARLAHARRGVAGEVVLLEVEARQRRERRRVLGRGLERRLDLLARGGRIVEVVELEQRQLEVELGDALAGSPSCRAPARSRSAARARGTPRARGRRGAGCAAARPAARRRRSPRCRARAARSPPPRGC